MIVSNLLTALIFNAVFIFGGQMGRILILFLCLLSANAGADGIASVQYVDNATKSKLDTSATSTQEMAGTYTVSGTLVVPTPPLPSAE